MNFGSWKSVDAMQHSSIFKFRFDLSRPVCSLARHSSQDIESMSDYSARIAARLKSNVQQVPAKMASTDSNTTHEDSLVNSTNTRKEILPNREDSDSFGMWPTLWPCMLYSLSACILQVRFTRDYQSAYLQSFHFIFCRFCCGFFLHKKMIAHSLLR